MITTNDSKNVLLPGFTLIELLVVISLIGILAAIVLANLYDARNQSKVARVQEELKSISLSLEQYRNQLGSLPPGADICTLCAFRPGGTLSQTALWETQVLPLVEAQTAARLPARDPWGTYYAYDNNFTVPATNQPSIVCSLGPNLTLNTWLDGAAAAVQRTAQGDDICVFLNEPDDT